MSENRFNVGDRANWIGRNRRRYDVVIESVRSSGGVWLYNISHFSIDPANRRAKNVKIYNVFESDLYTDRDYRIVFGE